MLEWVRIRNLALIAGADIEFGTGFNVITGETGAGKSVLLGTVSLLLGERADKSAIRAGEERCELAAGIGLPPYLPEEFYRLLDEAGVPVDRQHPELQLRRVITATRNRNFINDTPVTLETLKAAGDYLIDVHGANEHQSLLQPVTQLDLLDRFGHHEELRARCAAAYDGLRELEQRRDAALAGLPGAAEAEQLRITTEEIGKVNPQPGEDREIGEKYNVCANARQILELTGGAVNQLTEGEAGTVAEAVAAIHRTLTELQRIDADGADALLSSCDQIGDLVRELSGDIERYAARITINEEELQQLENRLADLHRLKRRYGPAYEDIFTHWQAAADRLHLYEHAAETRKELDAEAVRLHAELRDAAAALSEARKQAAETLARQITDKLQHLGFLRSAMRIDLLPLDAPGRHGGERVEFMFSANPGQPLQPLREIASSGEISRVMLAAKTVLAEADAIPILVFDEIDVNIGGETAVKVGEELRALAGRRQILCISHLPQVAAQGDWHFQVSKSVTGDVTTTKIVLLDTVGRKRELGRMLGGGAAALTHAAELLKSQNGKSTGSKRVSEAAIPKS